MTLMDQTETQLMRIFEVNLKTSNHLFKNTHKKSCWGCGVVVNEEQPSEKKKKKRIRARAGKGRNNRE